MIKIDSRRPKGSALDGIELSVRIDAFDASGDLAGYVTADDYKGFLVASLLYVQPRWRGCGLGRHLIERMIAAHSGRDITVRPAPHKLNPDEPDGLDEVALREFYGRLGFRPNGEIYMTRSCAKRVGRHRQARSRRR